MDPNQHLDQELETLRAEVAEWRRRAESAEAIAAERLARAETAERALRTAEAALERLHPPTVAVSSPPAPATETAGEAKPSGPKSWLDRWRRYTDSIN